MWLKTHSKAFMASDLDLDTPVRYVHPSIPSVSAGNTEHEYTTGTSWFSIMNYFKDNSSHKTKVTEYECFSKYKYRDFD